jgi:lipoprotein-anchoring transpeptidase ErfK/SrfK
MLRLVVPALFAAVVGTVVSTAPAESQNRPFWEQFFSPSYQQDYQDRPKRRRPQGSDSSYSSGNVRSLSSSTSARAANTRSARQTRPSSEDDDDDTVQQKPTGPKLLEGGPRPDISPISPKPVSVSTGQSSGTIVIDTAGRQLLLITGSGSALRYPISVGRDGFTWAGTEKISRIADWPDWHPPQEMRERDPRLPEKMLGGIKNPLGAKSLYLGNSLYRIHGTNDARTIGIAASSGCFRMLNGHVADLAGRVGVGTKVVVLPHLGAKPVATKAPDTTSGAKPQAASSPTKQRSSSAKPSVRVATR